MTSGWRWLVALALAAVPALWFWQAHDAGTPVEVATRDGVLAGREDAAVRRFLGIPYAAPPLGVLRWQPPQALRTRWSSVRDASRFAAPCVQGARPSLSRGGSEDCLYLNVWAPAKAGPHPVMVWVHGGGLMIGAASEAPYDGASLARTQDVIVVSMNYRLSWLGFFSLDGLQADAEPVSGNQGFLDQVAALRWVRDNIAAFGGDAGNVTVFGESGGAVSACLLLASPLTDGLLHKAILQSGVCGIQPVRTREQARQQTQDFLQKVGCADAADPLRCARALSPQQVEARGFAPGNILTADSRSFSFYPLAVNDGVFVDGVPQQQLQADAKRAIPVLLGTTADEGSLFTGQIDFPQTAAAYRDDLEQRFAGAGDALAAQYPFAAYQPIGRAYAAMFADAMEVCPTRRIAEQRAAMAPVYLYQFAQTPSAPLLGLMQLRHGFDAAPLGVYHGAEIPYVFGSNSVAGHVWRSEQRRTRAQVMRYWANFARRGDPNSEGLVPWPRYTTDDALYLRITAQPGVGHDLGADRCALWDRHPQFSFW